MTTPQRKYQQSESGRIAQQQSRDRYKVFKLLSTYMDKPLTTWVESQKQGKETKFATIARLLQTLKDS